MKHEADHDWPADKLLEWFSDPHRSGFTGDRCGSCGRTANVLSGIPGWFCVCGHFVLCAWDQNWKPHDAPDLGPSRSAMDAAIRQAREKRATP